MRRALTLVEVVAASALLTLIVVACIPLLRSARADLAAARGAIRAEGGPQFEAAVDGLLRDRPGLVALALAQPEGVHQRWAVGDQEYSAHIRVARLVRAIPEERRSSHAWLVFSTGGMEILRWARVPDMPEEDR